MARFAHFKFIYAVAKGITLRVENSENEIKSSNIQLVVFDP